MVLKMAFLSVHFRFNHYTFLWLKYIMMSNILQEDLLKLEQLEEDWDMNFNASKSQVLHVTRLKTPIRSKYYLYNIELESVSAANHQGVTISEDPRWGKHYYIMSSKRQIKFLASSNTILKLIIKN